MVDGEKIRLAFFKGIENLTDHSTAHVAEWHIQNVHKLAWEKFVDEPMRFEYALYDIFGDIYKIVEEEVAMEIALAFNIEYNGENFVQLAKKFKSLGIS